MAIFGKYFEFNGKSSKDFDLMIASFDAVDEVPMGLSRTVDTGEMNWYRYSVNHYGARYDNVLEFEVTVIKSVCNYNKRMQFTRNEIREINAWLTSPLFPKLFHMYDYDDQYFADEYIDYFVTISDVNTKYIGDIVGLTFTLKCDCPFGYSQEKRLLINTNELFTINNTSDELEGSIYPQLIVHPMDNKSVTISNLTQNKSFTFTPLGANDTIYIDCQNMTIKDKLGTLIPLYDLSVIDPVDVYWFELVSGENKILMVGNATIEIVWREYRKVGAY